MIKNLVALFSLVLTLTAINANATWLAPEDIRTDISPVPYRLSNTTEAQFKEVIQNIQTIYAPIVSQLGGRLSMSGNWKSETLNAGAKQMFGSWQVQITGALARRPELTTDGFTLILCHELGHHLGGFVIAPAQMPLEKPWGASEGQADYFATQACARKLWGAQPSINSSFRKMATAKIQNLCNATWSNMDEQNLCYRTLAAVESMTATMATLMNKPLPEFDTPDKNVVAQTSNSHPAVQCRMDTSAQGALCTVPFDETVIPGKKTPGGVTGIEAEIEASKSSCTAKFGFSVGLRPACWFKARL
jgi:hypothetical protein